MPCCQRSATRDRSSEGSSHANRFEFSPIEFNPRHQAAERHAFVTCRNPFKFYHTVWGESTKATIRCSISLSQTRLDSTRLDSTRLVCQQPEWRLKCDPAASFTVIPVFRRCEIYTFDKTLLNKTGICLPVLYCMSFKKLKCSRLFAALCILIWHLS